MLKLENKFIGIDQGSVVMFSDFENDGEMWSGRGSRAKRRHVRFRSAFRSAPVVNIGMSMWDMDRHTNARADIEAENVSETGFDLVFKTWGDSRVARVRASWMAIGELPNDDDWSLY